jgi:competence protein ComEC
MMITGILTAYLSNSILVTASMFVLLLVCLYVFARNSGSGFFVPAGMLAFFLLGSLEFLIIDNVQLRSFAEYEGSEVAIRGYIASEPDLKDSKVSYIVEAAGIRQGYGDEFKPIRGKILLTTLVNAEDTILDYGRELIFEGQLTQPQGVRNPGGFNYRRYLAQKGVGASIFAYPYTIETWDRKSRFSLIRAGMNIRDRIVHVIDNSLPHQQAGLLNGMLIGYREGLSDEVQEAFSNAGLTHIMAVSGANVAFLILPLSFLLKLLGIGKKLSNLLIIAFLILFVFVTGFEPSVLRAVLMAGVILLSEVLYKKPDTYAAIAFSCILLLVISPCMLFNIGFQLSYAATLGIVMLYKNIKKLITCKFVPNKVAEIIGGTLAAQLGVLPITLIHFNKLSLISIIPNILVAPILGLITILGMLMAILGQFSLYLSTLIGYLNNIFLSAVLYVTKWSSGVSFAAITTVTPSLIMGAAYYVVIWFLFWYKPLKGVSLKLRHGAAVLSIIAVFFLTGTLKPACMEVTFLDVGQGDCAFIRTYTGKTVLIDGGGSTNPNNISKVGERVVIPFLLDSGICSLDAVIATHPHSDHIQGLGDVLKGLGTKRLIIPSIENDAGFEELLSTAGSKNIPVTRCSEGDRIRLDDRTVMQVLNPPGNWPGDEESFNNASLVLKLSYGHTSILFTGDVEAEVEERIVSSGTEDDIDVSLLDVDVLKVAHHGSAYSSGKAFLDAVDPQAAIISVGRNNFGHPSEKVLNLLKESNVECFRTDECGAVVLKSDGSSIKIRRTVRGK